jgi:UDP-N-acetylglucosamine transferase subunit ALG13
LIFVSVGTQLPFDRLVRTVDEWALSVGRSDVVAQVGRSSYVPKCIKAHQFLDAGEFGRIQQSAALLVAHCGIGSMLSALELGQPVIMMPRLHSRGEHRNDHQLATAKQVRHIPGVHIAEDEHELATLLHRSDELMSASPISPSAPASFTTALKALLADLGR